jgi:hypothetical protein
MPYKLNEISAFAASLLAFNNPARDRTAMTVAGLKAELSEPGFS